MREAWDNTIKTLNLINLAHTSQTSCVFLGPDAEKGFDHIDWQFVFCKIGKYYGSMDLE